MISNLQKKVEENVPEAGTFEVEYETIDNPNPNWRLSCIRVAVRQLYSSTDKDERRRYVEVSVFNMPDNPYVCERLMFGGTKQELLQYLEDPDLASKIVGILPQMESDLNDF